MFHSRQSRLFIIAAAIVAVAAVVQCIGAWQDSQTTDEAVHLSAGRSYWQTHDFRLNPEHPPLIKLLAAAPLMFVPSTAIDTSSTLWQNRSEWLIGSTMLYGHGHTDHQAQLIMFLGRLPMIMIWGLLAWLIFTWSRKRWGPWAGFISLIMFCFDPNFLGHGHLVTTDVGVTLGFFATIWRFDIFLKKQTWRNVIVLSLIFGLTQVTKFSAIILWLIVPVLGLIAWTYSPKLISGRWWWRMVASLVVLTSLVTWVTYGFEIKRIDSDPRIAELWQERQNIVDTHSLDQQPPIVQKVIALADPATATGRMMERATHLSIPAYSYWRGLSSTLSHDIWGHPAYLLGQVSDQGWWYYFPIAILVKTPSLTLIMLTLAGMLGVAAYIQRFRRRQRTVPFDAWLLGLPPLLYFAWSLTSHINIGFRHIFPVEPFIFMAVGSLVSWTGLGSPRLWKKTLLVIACGLPLIAAIAWPNTLGYFSELIGGPKQGYRYLLDSNLDWNQDIWRLKSFLKSENFSEVHLVLFGSIPYNQLFPSTLPVLEDQAVSAGQKPTGIVIISAGQLYNADGPFHWLRPYTPKWRVGSSILVYDFR